MSEEKKPSNYIKLVWKNGLAEAAGLGIAALLAIVILLLFAVTGGGALLQ